MKHRDRSGEGGPVTVTGSRPARARWIAFCVIGTLGIGVQLTIVWLLTGWADVSYLAGTAIGVEAAVIHNFFWHERWTWADRPAASRRSAVSRLARFNAANGLLSIWGNVGLTALFVGAFGTGYLGANLMAIASCSMLNFIVADKLVFAEGV